MKNVIFPIHSSVRLYLHSPERQMNSRDILSCKMNCNKISRYVRTILTKINTPRIPNLRIPYPETPIPRRCHPTPLPYISLLMKSDIPRRVRLLLTQPRKNKSYSTGYYVLITPPNFSTNSFPASTESSFHNLTDITSVPACSH
jgi:hypothetical protein